jgi:hypothetical protein
LILRTGNPHKKDGRVPPDLIIALNSSVLPESIERIKNETDAIVVCWFTDSAANLGRQHVLSAPYDILFIKELFEIDKEKCHNARSLHPISGRLFNRGDQFVPPFLK